MILPQLLATLLACGLIVKGADWPQWRGPARDGHVPAALPIEKLPPEVKPVWKIKVGGGHSSPVVSGGKLFYLDEADGREVVHCLDAATGQELWRKPFADAYQDEWGLGPRCTPFVDGDRIYVQSCNGEFRCLLVKDGADVWRTNFADFGVKFLGSKAREGTASRRGNTGSGFVDGPRVIVPVGSKDGATLVAFDKLSGKVIWKALNDEAAYASLMVGAPGGIRQVLAFTADAIAGVELETGRPLWRVPLKTDAKRHAATPVVSGNRVVVNSHTIGLVCLEILPEAGSLAARIVWERREHKVNIATPVVVGEFLFSQGSNKDFICINVVTGKTEWSAAGFGLGRKDYSSTIAIAGNLLILSEDGQLVLARTNPQKFEELGRLQLCGNTWSHPAVVDGRIFARDSRELLCVDLRSVRN